MQIISLGLLTPGKCRDPKRILVSKLVLKGFFLEFYGFAPILVLSKDTKGSDYSIQVEYTCPESILSQDFYRKYGSKTKRTSVRTFGT
jgi:hypothetical protein